MSQPQDINAQKNYGEIQNQMSQTAPLGNTYSNTMYIYIYTVK